MMTEFRVTKYNPHLRLADGSYPVSEWTSVSDIGRAFRGQILGCNQYLAVEDEYVEAIHRFLGLARVGSLKVEDLEILGVPDVPDLRLESEAQLSLVSNNAEVAGEQLDWVARLALREALWCRLSGPGGFFVHFGNDYYMYIGSRRAQSVPPLPQGIYAESFASPYHRDSDLRE